MTDATNLIRIVQETQPDEIYNLAAQSHVQVSFETPEYTANSDALGTLRLLEAIRILGMEKKPAASIRPPPRSSSATPRRSPSARPPRSLRAAPTRRPSSTPTGSRVNYREAYGLHASNGILFNHESPIRGETFVTRKITRAVARIALGMQDVLYLGNLDSRRDWGHARDYVRAMHLMLQQDQPDDYVIATGEQHSVREFVEAAFAEVGIELALRGQGVDEVGVVDGGGRAPCWRKPATATDRWAAAEPRPTDALKPGRTLVQVDPRYFRPTEVMSLLGDATKARAAFGWEPTTGSRSWCTRWCGPTWWTRRSTTASRRAACRSSTGTTRRARRREHSRTRYEASTRGGAAGRRSTSANCGPTANCSTSSPGATSSFATSRPCSGSPGRSCSRSSP